MNSASDDSESYSVYRGNGETILICDDDEFVLSSMKALISSFGYHVMVAASSAKAIEAMSAYQGKVSLLITDISMPETDGIQLARTLQRMNPELEVLCTSGYGEKFADALEDAQFEFVAKPVTGKTLSRLIHSALQKNS